MHLASGFLNVVDWRKRAVSWSQEITFFFFLTTPCGMWNFSGQESNLRSAVEAQSLNHWTTREVQETHVFILTPSPCLSVPLVIMTCPFTLFENSWFKSSAELSVTRIGLSLLIFESKFISYCRIDGHFRDL